MGEQTKIRFKLGESPISGETVWAEEVGEELFQLRNTPFYAFGYAEGDIVRAIPIDGQIEVVGIEHSSGNGTLRLMFGSPNIQVAEEVLNELTGVGCTYERASPLYVAVTCPPTIDVPFSQLANYLNGLSDEVLAGWEIGKRPTPVNPT